MQGERDPGFRFFVRHVGTLKFLNDWMAKLHLGELIDQAMPSDPQQKLSHGRTAEVFVANRLCSPRPLYKVQEWAQKAGVDLTHGIDPSLLNDDRLGRTLEALGENAGTLKGLISLALAERFGIELKAIHWDLTTLELSGEYEADPGVTLQAHYARNAPGGQATKAVKVGLDVANDGKGPFPASYELYSGNQDEYSATIQNLQTLREKLKLDHVIRINDRGCFSAQIVAHTRKEGFDLISAVPLKGGRREELMRAVVAAGPSWQTLSYLSQKQGRKKDPAQQDRYRAAEVGDYEEYEGQRYEGRLLLVQSDGKLKRDRRTRERHQAKIERDLSKLRGKLGQKGQTAARVKTRLEKILKRYGEGEWYELQMQSDPSGRPVAMSWTVNEQKKRDESLLDGHYGLFTTLPATSYSSDQVFTLYKRQFCVENGHRILKGPLRVTPIFLHNMARIEGMVFVLWLALIAYMLLEREYRNRTGDERRRSMTTAKLLECFETYSYVLERRAEAWVATAAGLYPEQQEIYRTLGLVASGG